MQLPKFLKAETVTFNAGWLYVAVVVEIVQLAIIFW